MFPYKVFANFIGIIVIKSVNFVLAKNDLVAIVKACNMLG